jgi:hypothetical protein
MTAIIAADSVAAEDPNSKFRRYLRTLNRITRDLLSATEKIFRLKRTRILSA